MGDYYFNLKLEFDKEKINRTINDAIVGGASGYVCSIDGNNMVTANENPVHRDVINGALVNLCDSAWIPFFINRIYKKNFKNYTGADLFTEYIRMQRYRQYFLGSTPEVLRGLRNELCKIDPKIADMRFETLPFRKVEDFDYQAIAKEINADAPDIVWVSLGAPKQEQFMQRLQPYLKRGVMFGFGAIFNFNSGLEGNRRAPRWMQKLKMEWFFRTCQDPFRLASRYTHILFALPRILWREIKKKQ
jgi:N-acetylglucosaminyldiphosphoundecaprenol N-acetyl-beta-D-mannosaminyltransferase